ncbi:accessory gene regulator B family protein [Paenibacillus sp. UNC451MF]|uniref:accessory gene regulator B family protein n=1 Tax=Paenibacillus sp. UNC451MF TaxID=1449063 RepID=UPI0009DE152F|nr:accessory gene regulator B family protein [Paenibacillus sp. UNC451MF]
MNFIDQSAEYIAKSIRNNHSGAGSEIALKYSLILLINTSLSIVISMIICLATGHLLQCLVGIFAYMLIRFVTGGLHMSSSLSCCLLSIIIFNSIAITNFNYNSLFIFLDIVSICTFYITAPNNIQDISKINPKYYPILRILAILIVSSNFYFQSTILTAAFFIQAFLTTKYSYTIRDFVERRYVYEK